MQSELFPTGEIILPPVKETKRKLMQGIQSGLIPAKQIFLNYTSLSPTSGSPKHIRMPKQRYSTKSQLSSIDAKTGRLLKIFNPPLSMEKEYLTKKIKRTVKHYFQARRSSMDSFISGPNFNKEEMIKLDAELFTDKDRHRVSDRERGREKNKDKDKEKEKDKTKERKEFTQFHLDIEIDEKKHQEIVYDTPIKTKIQHAPSKSFMVVNFNNQQELDSPTESKEQEAKNKRRLKNIKRISRRKTENLSKIDQGLQTDENSPSRESTGRRQELTKLSMYEILDDILDQ